MSIPDNRSTYQVRAISLHDLNEVFFKIAFCCVALSSHVGEDEEHSKKLRTIGLFFAAIVSITQLTCTGDKRARPGMFLEMNGSVDSQSRRDAAVGGRPVADGGEKLSATHDLAGSTRSILQMSANLKVAWTFSTGVDRGQEAAPIVVGDTMYVVTPYPNILYALDLKNNGAMKWKYEPNPELASQGVACCDTVNRGAAYSNGKVFINTLDGNTCAVDAATGKEIWKTKLGDINKGETITMSPLVVKGKVIVGNCGGEFGVRGWIAALNADDGSIAWKAYNTGPDADVLIGANFHPFYEMDKGKDLASSTWPPDQWKIGGGTVWGWVSYDPEADLIYYGTGNPGVWNPELRPGDNKW